MKILANENVPLASVDKLSEAGFDIVSLSRLSPGIDDASVLQLARDQKRILITFDRDYGELIYRRGLLVPVSVIYMRFIPSSPLEPAEIPEPLFAQGESIIKDFFIVLDRDGFRRRPLPI